MTDLHLLLRARLFVARLGELDVLKWWPTDGVLGPDGSFVGRRVLPRTHPTGRTRIALAVARQTCDDRHPAPGIFHLFRLDNATEDEFESFLLENLANGDLWHPLMATLEAVGASSDARSLLLDAGIVTEVHFSAVSRLELGPGGRSLPISSSKSEDLLRLLAAGFTRGSVGSLVVPFVAEVSS